MPFLSLLHSFGPVFFHLFPMLFVKVLNVCILILAVPSFCMHGTTISETLYAWEIVFLGGFLRNGSNSNSMVAQCVT